jgi:hypothetical protein
VGVKVGNGVGQSDGGNVGSGVGRSVGTGVGCGEGTEVGTCKIKERKLSTKMMKSKHTQND